MDRYIRLTSVATFLLGLHLLGPKLVDASVQINLPSTTSSEQSLVGQNTTISTAIAPIAQYTIAFHPPDKGGPRISRSAGTR